MENKDEIKRLFSKYLERSASTEEVDRLLALFRTEDIGLLEELVRQELNDHTEVDPLLMEQVHIFTDRVSQRLPKLINPTKQEKQRIKPFAAWAQWVAAAVVVIAFGLGVYLYISKDVTHYAPTAYTHPQDIDPGGNKAILTLADGRKIVLDDAADGQLAEENGIKITKTDDGQIVYEIEGTGDTDGKGSKGVKYYAPTYNTIKTPRGGQYKVILPDSSCVWLNAASSLRYPTRFSATERRVELTGEAYFEVAKARTTHNSQLATKFIVQTPTQEVEVLGTHFNINAYEDEAVARTTLVEGSVAVRPAASRHAERSRSIPSSVRDYDDSQQLILIPGEQSVLYGNSLTKQTVDTETAIAWKNGVFFFKGIPFDELMRQLARWYDFEYEGIYNTNSHFTVYMRRSVKLSEILQVMEKAKGDLHFEIVKEKGGRKKVVISRKD